MSAEDGSLRFATALGQRPGASAIGFGSLWVAQPDRGVVARLDLEDGSITDTIRLGTSPAWGEPEPGPLGARPSDVAFTTDGVWVSVAPAGVARIAVADPSVTLIQSVGNGPTAALPAFDSIWVANHLDGTITRLEPSHRRGAATISVREGTTELAGE